MSGQPVGIGVVDWVGQLRALRKDGYHYAVSLETHWRGAGTPEASSRISMADLKKALAECGRGLLIQAHVHFLTETA